MCVDELYENDPQPSLGATRLNANENLLDVTPNPADRGESSGASDTVDVRVYGPIRVKPRTKPAPTIGNGRRSMYDVLTPTEERRREIRRAQNRAAAERVRLSRLSIEMGLHEQINVLEDQERQLTHTIQELEEHKLRLQAHLLMREDARSTTTECPLRNDNAHSLPTPANEPSTEFDFHDSTSPLTRSGQESLSPASNPSLSNMTLDELEDYLRYA